MAVGGAHTVGAGIAAANDEHMLALCHHYCFFRDGLAGHPAVVLLQEFHGEVYPLQLAAGDVQVAGNGRSAAEQQGVKIIE